MCVEIQGFTGWKLKSKDLLVEMSSDWLTKKVVGRVVSSKNNSNNLSECKKAKAISKLVT